MVKVLKRKNERVSPAVAAAVRRLYSQSVPVLLGEAILFTIIAVFAMVYPMFVVRFMTFAIGAGLALFGLYRTIAGFVSSRDWGSGWFDMLFGVANIILGLIMCINPDESASGVVFMFAIIFLFKALGTIIFAVNMARARFGHYMSTLIMSVLLLGVAILLMFFPRLGAVALVYCLAAALFIYAAADLNMFIELLRLKRYTNKN